MDEILGLIQIIICKVLRVFPVFSGWKIQNSKGNFRLNFISSDSKSFSQKSLSRRRSFQGLCNVLQLRPWRYNIFLKTYRELLFPFHVYGMMKCNKQKTQVVEIYYLPIMTKSWDEFHQHFFLFFGSKSKHSEPSFNVFLKRIFSLVLQIAIYSDERS